MQDLDPLLKLLFAATASESSRLEKQMARLREQVREAFVEGLLPETLFGPRPAYGVLQARALEASCIVDHETRFETSRQLQDHKEAVPLAFFPLMETTLINLQKEVFYAHGKCIRLSDGKILYDEDRRSGGQSIWLGLRVDESVQSLDGLSFFFDVSGGDWQDGFDPDLIFSDLRLFLGDREMSLHKPLTESLFYASLMEQDQLKSPGMLSYADIVADAAASLSDVCFVLTDPGKTHVAGEKRPYPPHFAELFDDESLKDFTEELLWLEFRVKCPLPKTGREIGVHVNALPVINLNRLSLSLSRDEPVQKLEVPDYEHVIGLLDYRLLDEYHNTMDPMVFSSLPFTIRSNAAEKYSTHELEQLLDELFYRYQHDYSAFEEFYELGHDEISSLHKIMLSLEESRSRRKVPKQGAAYYGILKHEKSGGAHFAELSCATCHGTLGNDIQPGTSFSAPGAMVEPSSVMLLQRTMNGRRQLSYDEKVQSARYFFLTHDRIISNDDIRHFCMKEMPHPIQKIDIKTVAAGRTRSLSRILLVTVELKKKGLRADELYLMKKRMENKIARRSSLVLPLRIEIRQPG